MAIKFIYCLKFLVDIWLLKSQKNKIVWTVHNLVAHNAKFPRLEKWLKQIFLGFVDHVIVHSQAAKDSVLQAYSLDSAKVAVIPHGHYRDVYPPAIAQKEARQQLNLPSQGLIFLNFGMLKPYKGIDKVLEIWRDHREAIAGHHLLIVGKALDESYGADLATEAAEIKNVELRDQFVPNEEIHLYFSAADVIVLPFNQILTSGSLLLAISYGKPVIAPSLANIQETMGEATDFLYDSTDSSDLLRAIQASIVENLLDAGRKVSVAGDRLDWHQIALKTKQVYQA